MNWAFAPQLGVLIPQRELVGVNCLYLMASSPRILCSQYQDGWLNASTLGMQAHTNTNKASGKFESTYIILKPDPVTSVLQEFLQKVTSVAWNGLHNMQYTKPAFIHGWVVSLKF